MNANRAPSDRRLAIAVRGVVQGVGFRPFVYRVARELGLAGWVLNASDTVRIEVQGTAAAVDAFVDALRNAPPPQARIDALDVQDVPCEDAADHAFVIRASSGNAAPRPTIPADLATCPECLAEIRTAGERRFNYPFTNCTHCGPRWSIVRGVPYDRPRTAMAGFPLCDACRREYDDPSDRRFHAQPVACPHCGPELQCMDPAGRVLASAGEALARAAEAIRAGQIVALMGLGGFQLLVDATSQAAVVRLRQRKRRPDKPFAVMLPTLDDVRRRCACAAEEAQALASPAAPIVLLRCRDLPEGDAIAPAVAPGNPCLGVMLPYTPLHHLLLDALARPIVCTSGNVSEEPMAITIADAVARLGPIADVLLVHNRPIVRPVDDSVVQRGPAGMQVLRRARGYAPLPIDLGWEAPTVLAVGGHLKNTVALSIGAQVVLSGHVGDLDNVAGVDVHRRAIDDLVDFFQQRPAAVACDLHPDYASTRVAESLAARWGVPLIRVQHHHAHVAAAMAEHRLEGPVLGFSWDGTGYGSDGTVWGGEALWCAGAACDRVAHLRPFALPGGDRAARQPRRSALALLFALDPQLAADAVQGKLPVDLGFTAAEAKTLLAMLQRGVNAPRTTSMGRLFDGIAALAGMPREISFEGQAAMALQFAAEADCEERYPLPLVADKEGSRHAERACYLLDWGPLLRAVLADLAAGVPAGRISARFHNGLADAAMDLARACGLPPVVLTGGCFQNALLAARVHQALSAAGAAVYTHQKIPPGDGGIAVGQILVAVRQLQGA